MRNSLLRRYAAAHGGALSELERANVVKETCRKAARTCAAMLARWIVDTPESAERRELRAELARRPAIAQRLRLNDVERLLWLYDGAPDAASQRLTPANVLQASDLFADLYHHAVPFSRKALAKLWQRCAADPEQAASLRRGPRRA